MMDMITKQLTELFDSDDSDDEISIATFKSLYEVEDNEPKSKRKSWVKNTSSARRWRYTDLYQALESLDERAKLSNTMTKEFKSFKRRYRFPFPIFVHLVEMIRPLFKHPTQRSQFFDVAPFELKVLAALRHLGRGLTFDDLSEIIGIGEETLRVFTREFCWVIAKNFYKTWVNVHRNGPVRHLMHTYPGLPGCIGSIDGVHVTWERCPAKRASTYTGKAGHPTLVYNVACDHSRRIISCTMSSPGNKNDKSIVLYDQFVERIRLDKRFTDFEFALRDKTGKESIERGCYLICDGGYRAWRVLQAPSKYSSEDDERMISSAIESYRKDIECVFGSLKKRWKCLKHPIIMKFSEDIDAMFFTCCILHNMLLEWDDGYVKQREATTGNLITESTDLQFESDSENSDDNNWDDVNDQIYCDDDSFVEESDWVTDAREKELYKDLRRKLITQWINTH